MLNGTVAMVLISASLTVKAECVYPKAPAVVPSGATASEPEMVAAMKAFKSYDSDVNSYGACLDQEAKERSVTGTAQSLQLKTLQAKKLNAAVADLQVKTKVFNEQVRAFKARS